MEAERQTVEMVALQAQPAFSIKLIKGQKQTYGWEIKVTGDDEEEVVNKIYDLNTRLVQTYGTPLE